MDLKIPNAETIKVEDLWYEVTTDINDTFLIGACTIYNHTERSVKHFTDTVQAIRNITNFRAKHSYEFVRISYLNSCTKFVKNSFTNSRVNSHINSCVNITFLKKGYGEKCQYH